MPFNGSGGYALPGAPLAPNTTADAVAVQDKLTDIQTALNTAWLRDGQVAPSANIPMGGRKFTNLGAGTNDGDAVNLAQLKAAVGARAKDFGAKGDGTTDDSAAIQAAIDATAAAGGGVVWFDPGNYVATITIKSGVTLDCAYRTARLIAPVGATRGVVESEYFWEHVGLRAQNARVGGDTTVQVPAAVPPTSVGQTINIHLDSGGIHVATLTGIAGTTWTFTPALPSAVSIGNQIENASAPGPVGCGIGPLWIDGRSYTEAPLNNICQAQTPAGSGAMTMNGALVTGGVAWFSYQSSLHVVVTCAGDETGKSITVTGIRRNPDNTITTGVTDTITLGPAGVYAGRPIFERVTGVTWTGSAAAGSVSVGAGDGRSGRAGVALFGTSWQVDGTYIGNTRGPSLRTGWIVPAGGFGPPGYNNTKNQQGSLRRVDLYEGDGGGYWTNGPVDSAGGEVYINYPLGFGIYMQRNAPGIPFNAGHINGGNTGVGPWREPWVGVLMEAESSSLGSGFKVEGCRGPRVIMRANNCRLDDVDLFHINDSRSVTGVQIGDTGWTNIRGYRITGQSRWNDNPVDFFSDGGWGYINLTGYVTLRTLAASALSGATFLRIDTPWVARDGFAVGNTVSVFLDTGAWHSASVTEVTAEGVTPAGITISPGLPSAAAAGNPVSRGRAYTGTPDTSNANGSNIYIDMEQGQPSSFAQDLVTNGAWTPYTPTLTVTSGSLTSASATGAFLRTGRLVQFQAQVTITTNGTAAGELRVSLPATVIRNMAGQGWENNTSLGSVQVRIVGGVSYAAIYTLANAYPGANGRLFIISGSFEAA